MSKHGLSLRERLENYTHRADGEDGCWVWTGCRSSSGYGALNVAGRMVATHRLAWEMANGAIPSGLFICHSCDNPSCINPAHLFLGTHIQNMADCKSKKRTMRGERHHQAKLSISVVREIRLGNGPLRFDAVRFGVSESTITRIRHGKLWGHLHD